MKIFRISSHNEYLEHATNIGHEFLDRLAKEKEILHNTQAPLTIDGFSYPAGKTVPFTIIKTNPASPSISWSETVVCPLTNLCNRKRGLLHMLDIEAAPYPHTTIYLTEQLESDVYDLLASR